MGSIQYLFFITNALITISLLLLVMRKFDFIAIYIIILFLYSVVLFFGVIVNPYSGQYINASQDTFVVMGLAYLGSTIVLLTTKSNYTIKHTRPTNIDRLGLKVILIFSLIGLLLYMPVLLSSTNKKEITESSGNLLYFILYSYFPVAGFLLALKAKNKLFLIIFGMLLLFSLAYGGRVAFTTAVLGASVLLLENKPLRLISKYKLIVSGCLALLILILSKRLYGYILFYGLSEGFLLWLESFDLTFLLAGSEFLSTSQILDFVIVNNYQSDKIYYFYSFLALLPIPTSLVGYSSSYFNDHFQPALFYGLDYGLAYNIWAEAYASFGYGGVVFISIFIPLILNALWKAYCNMKSSFIAVILLVIGVTIGFWIQRNSLGSISAYIRNIFYPLLIAYFITFLVQGFFKKKKHSLKRD